MRRRLNVEARRRSPSLARTAPSTQDCYTVDDGTGILDCVFWRDAMQAMAGPEPRSSPGMRPAAARGFQLGDCVLLHGKLKSAFRSHWGHER